MSRLIDTFLSLDQANGRIRDLSEPGEPVEVSMADALGLVLAEPLIADVDLPPFDRAAREGFAVRASDALPGALLRVAGTRRSMRSLDQVIEAGEAIRVASGDPMPGGADSVLPLDQVRLEPETGPTRVVEVRSAVEPGRDVRHRGQLLEAGTEIAPAGTRLRASMVGLLASQGCVHPVCHRRVRLAVMAEGDHLVGPSEAPVMHRERNASNASIVALALQAGAMPHDLQAVPPSRFESAFQRATMSPVIVILGPPSKSIRQTFRSFGVESIFSGVALRPGGRTRYGVIRDDTGRAAHHVFHLPMAPVAAAIAFTLLVRPLIARIQGESDLGSSSSLNAYWNGPHRSSRSRLQAVPITLVEEESGRRQAMPIELRGLDDSPSFARADGLALLPAGAGPWLGGERVEVVRLD